MVNRTNLNAPNLFFFIFLEILSRIKIQVLALILTNHTNAAVLLSTTANGYCQRRTVFHLTTKKFTTKSKPAIIIEEVTVLKREPL